MTAILGGLAAAILWATATLASSRSSRMLGSRVVIGWVMLVGAIVAFPLAILSPFPAGIPPASLGVLLLSGVCYVVGLQITYAALRIGKVSIIAPIVATEGAVAALIAVALGDALGLTTALLLGAMVLGVVLASLDRTSGDVPAGDIDLVADALEGPAPDGDSPGPPGGTRAHDAEHDRRAIVLAIAAALVFGLGLVTAGKSAQVMPVAWVGFVARLVGIVGVTLPLVITGRFAMTRKALPLILVAGVGEIFGSMASAWGARESIAISAVLGSQFAAIAAVAAYLLFHERLARVQVVGVVLIVTAVSALAASSL